MNRWIPASLHRWRVAGSLSISPVPSRPVPSFVTLGPNYVLPSPLGRDDARTLRLTTTPKSDCVRAYFAICMSVCLSVTEREWVGSSDSPPYSTEKSGSEDDVGIGKDWRVRRYPRQLNVPRSTAQFHVVAVLVCKFCGVHKHTVANMSFEFSRAKSRPRALPHQSMAERGHGVAW